MTWFRTHRRYIVAIAALAVVSLALVRYLCPPSLGDAGTLPSAAVPADFCGPQGCTSVSGGGAVSDQALPANPLSPLLVAVFFVIVGTFALTQSGLPRVRRFHRLPGYPPNLQFYRLRI